MKRLWQDTLFKRLFLLMWVALVVSHLAAFFAFRAVLPPLDDGPAITQLPPLPSLPPAPWEHPLPPPPHPVRKPGFWGALTHAWDGLVWATAHQRNIKIHVVSGMLVGGKGPLYVLRIERNHNGLSPEESEQGLRRDSNHI